MTNVLHTRKLLLVNDKEYKVADGAVTCAVNYNEFFLPLTNRFAEVTLVGRQNLSKGVLPFPVPGVQFFGVPTYGSYVDFVRRYRLGADGKMARRVLTEAITRSDIVLMTLGCFFASDVVKLCRTHDKSLVIEVIDDALTAVTHTQKYRGVLRWIALSEAKRRDRYYQRLCARFPSLILGRELYERYRPGGDVKCVEFFENIMEEPHYRFGRQLFTGGVVRMLFVGRLVPMKAVEDVLSAASILARRGVKVECQIAGYGDDLDALRSQAGRLGLEKQVSFPGFVKYGENMFALYDWADVLVLPSVGGEGVPRVLLEALGRGCVVVATEVCGIPTVIQDGVTGMLVPPRRPDLIAAAIEKVGTDEEARERLLSGAREFCLRHTRTKQLARLIDFLESIGGTPT